MEADACMPDCVHAGESSITVSAFAYIRVLQGQWLMDREVLQYH